MKCSCLSGFLFKMTMTCFSHNTCLKMVPKYETEVAHFQDLELHHMCVQEIVNSIEHHFSGIPTAKVKAFLMDML